MPWKRMISTVFMTLIVGLTAACGTTSVRVAQIPMREGLNECVALEALQPEDLPPVAESPEAREVQILERAFWVRRDIAQTAIGRQMCNRNGELVSLIEANNAGPEN
jgi:hypothetical protein